MRRKVLDLLVPELRSQRVHSWLQLVVRIGSALHPGSSAGTELAKGLVDKG